MDHPAQSTVTMLTGLPKHHPPRCGTKIDSPQSFLVQVHYQQNNRVILNYSRNLKYDHYELA